MSESPTHKRRSPALVMILVIGAVCLGGVAAAVLYARLVSDPVRLPPPAAMMTRSSVDVRANGSGAATVGVNEGTINIHNGAVPGTKVCGDGLQPYGERCVTQPMADYISCVEASGGNKQDIAQTVTSEGKKKTAAAATGSVKGAIVEGSGKLALDLDDEASLVAKLESKWFPGGMSECSNLLRGPLRRAALDAHKKPPTH